MIFLTASFPDMLVNFCKNTENLTEEVQRAYLNSPLSYYVEKKYIADEVMIPPIIKQAIIDYHINANMYAPVLDLEVDEYDMENPNSKRQRMARWRAESKIKLLIEHNFI